MRRTSSGVPARPRRASDGESFAQAAIPVFRKASQIETTSPTAIVG
jgi:hypothetical protein